MKQLTIDRPDLDRSSGAGENRSSVLMVAGGNGNVKTSDVESEGCCGCRERRRIYCYRHPYRLLWVTLPRPLPSPHSRIRSHPVQPPCTSTSSSIMTNIDPLPLIRTRYRLRNIPSLFTPKHNDSRPHIYISLSSAPKPATPFVMVTSAYFGVLLPVLSSSPLSKSISRGLQHGFTDSPKRQTISVYSGSNNSEDVWGADRPLKSPVVAPTRSQS